MHHTFYVEIMVIFEFEVLVGKNNENLAIIFFISTLKVAANKNFYLIDAII